LDQSVEGGVTSGQGRNQPTPTAELAISKPKSNGLFVGS